VFRYNYKQKHNEGMSFKQELGISIIKQATIFGL